MKWLLLSQKANKMTAPLPIYQYNGASAPILIIKWCLLRV